MDRGLVSVVIPTYNRSAFLAQAVSSVLDQCNCTTEILVVDDGSTDGTAEVLDKFGEKISYFRKENGGASSARNFGIRRSHGEYVAFLDSDDVWHPDKIAQQLSALEKNSDFGFSFTDIEYIDEAGNVKGTTHLRERTGQDGLILDNLIKDPFCIASFLFFRREVLDATGYFDEGLSTAEDMDIMFRAAYRYKAILIDKPLVKYRRTGNSLSNTLYSRNRLKAIEKIETYAPDFYAVHETDIRNTIAKIHYSYGKDLLWKKRFRDSRKELIRSLKQRVMPRTVLLLFKCLAYALFTGNSNESEP